MQTPGDDETGPSCTVSQAARRQRASESAEARASGGSNGSVLAAPSCLRNSGGEAEPLISTPSSGQSTTSRPLVADKRGTPRANEVCSTASLSARWMPSSLAMTTTSMHTLHSYSLATSLPVSRMTCIASCSTLRALTIAMMTTLLI